MGTHSQLQSCLNFILLVDFSFCSENSKMCRLSARIFKQVIKARYNGTLGKLQYLHQTRPSWINWLIFCDLKTGKAGLVSIQNSIGCIHAQNCKHFLFGNLLLFLILLIKSGENLQLWIFEFSWYVPELTYFFRFGVYFQAVSKTLMGCGSCIF